MRPLGLLGRALSGGPPFAGLGLGGAPSAGTYLRGDGQWAAPSTAPFGNSQLFTASGTFTVPAGITTIAVLCIGGSGGGGGGGGGGTGGTTSFGSYMSALGGGGGQMGTYGAAPQGGSTYDPVHVVAAGPSGGHGGNEAGCRNTSGTVNYGKGMKGGHDGGSGWYMTGGDGGVILGIMSVTPGQQIGVTIGAAGSPYYGTASNPGALIVRY